MTVWGGNTFKLKLTVSAIPFRIAVITIVWEAVTEPAVAANVATDAPVDTVTLAGTLSAASLVPSLTSVPPGGAGPVNNTEQVATPPSFRLATGQVIELSVTCPSVIYVLCELPLYVTDILAIWVLLIVPAVAVKVPTVVPAGTATKAGSGNWALSLERVTEMPPVGAGADSVMVQVANWLVTKFPGEQLTDRMVT